MLRNAVFQNGLRAASHKHLGFLSADPTLSGSTRFGQQRRTTHWVVRIHGENMHDAIADHPLAPVFAQDLAERIRHEVEDVLSDYGERDALARRGRMFD